MFNFPTNLRPPGFRVGPSGEPETDEATPGFAVPEGGYGPSGNPLQTTPAGGFNVDPQGLVPVNCTSSDGSTNCMTPGGQSFIEPRPQGFPARIEPGDPDYHYYRFRSEPLDIPADKLLQAIIANPTPNFTFARAATPEGTLNEATPDWMHGLLYAPFLGAGSEMPLGPFPVTPLSPVTSYVTRDKDGNPMVVNITQPSHSLSPGYVVIYVTSTGGKSTIHVEGEGTSELQSTRMPTALRGIFNDNTWQTYAKTIGRQVK
jgi:hypothetical protein